MHLETDRLTIRRITADEWPSIKEIWVDFNASSMSQYDRPHNTSDEDVRCRMARWAAVNDGTEHMFFAICLGDVMIGYSAFHHRADEYEIGYCFHSAYHGRGYAKESHLALFRYLRTMGITRFVAGTAMKNVPSVSLLRSLGFTQVGTESVSFYKDAQGHDVVFEGGIFALNTAQ